MDIELAAVSMSSSIKESMSGQKSNIKDLIEDYKDLKNQIKDVNKNINEIKLTGKTDIADRVIEIEKELNDI